MTNKEKLIKIYNKALEKGELLEAGLCVNLVAKNISRKKLNLFKPIENISSNRITNTYWASGYYETDNIYAVRYKFTPLRQTILAFLIAMEE